MSFDVNLTGMSEIQDAIKNMSDAVSKEVSNEMQASVMKIASDAKKLAPINFGELRNSIRWNKESELTYSVGAYASYAPYLEFGTGPLTTIPNGYSTFASQFQQKKGGKFKDMVNALTLWVQRKGIAGGKNPKSLAYIIALSILKKGMRPQPYLIPAFEQEKNLLIERLKNILNAKS
jgi:HK97 gp10 family phage protein